jgi:hypothetical protein
VVDELPGERIELGMGDVERLGHDIGPGRMSDRGCRDQLRPVATVTEELPRLQDFKLQLSRCLTMVASQSAVLPRERPPAANPGAANGGAGSEP